MLSRLLHIGKDPPDSKSVFYQPVVFNCSSRIPFFLELFSRTMWLLSRTRREMKVTTIDDYPKVISDFFIFVLAKTQFGNIAFRNPLF